MARTIKIFDTTLRDGEQSPGCSMNIQEKLEMAVQLEKLGVNILEAGFAISSPGDFEAIQKVAAVVKNCSVASLGRALKKDTDASYEALKGAVAPRIHIVLATSPIHLKYKMKMSEDEVLAMAIEAVTYAKTLCSDVEFSLEDATRTGLEYMSKIVDSVIKCGATVVNIPDTVGYASPEEMYDIIAHLRNNVPNIDKVDLSAHVHNDLGLGVANSLAAIRAGATQVECTINGIGERAGNAALEEIVMNLKTRKDYYNADTTIDTTQIYRTSKLLSSITGVHVQPNKSIVGANAFAHESGIHQHGVLAERTTYEIMSPESVGISQNKMVLGKHSGRHAFDDRIKYLGYELTPERLNEVFDSFKVLADKKKVVSDEDIIALLGHGTTDVAEVYKYESFVVSTGNNISAMAVVKLNKNGEIIEQSAIGDGPVDATFNCVDLIMNNEYEVEDYTIRAVSEGQDALGEVVIRIKHCGKTVTGKGLSTDIIESSIKAYLNAINKILAMQRP